MFVHLERISDFLRATHSRRQDFFLRPAERRHCFHGTLTNLTSRVMPVLGQLTKFFLKWLWIITEAKSKGFERAIAVFVYVHSYEDLGSRELGNLLWGCGNPCRCIIIFSVPLWNKLQIVLDNLSKKNSRGRYQEQTYAFWSLSSRCD